MKKFLFIFLCITTMVGCNSINPVKSAFTKSTPYEQYINSLEKADLKGTPMAEAWIAAGQRVFNDSVLVNLPFTETGFFPAAEPEARSYRFDVKEGQVLTVEGTSMAQRNGKLFMDLFIWKDQQWKQLAHADSSLLLQEEFRDDYNCLLRLQPELLINAHYTLNISLTPVLANPVSGASNRSIGSFYGADRDGGRRSHEGVDIFAPRGTPVIAPTDGYVSRVGNNGLGGKVVWMRDGERGHSYYFAHLDEQLVQSGMSVSQGDTLGLVGNTGNARTTPPHLHFGIYQRGSKDPINFIRTLEELHKSKMDTSFRVQAFKVLAKKANFRTGPGEKHAALDQLAKDTFVKVLGRSQGWYRISLPDQTQGYIYENLLGPISGGAEKLLTDPAVVFTSADTTSVPVALFNEPVGVEVLAQFKDFRYVETEDGITGWIVQ